jgi:hypothetical protein
MPLKKHSICIRWKDVTCEDLMAFHGVRLNMAKHVKCFIKNFFSNSGLTLHAFAGTYFHGRDFCSYIGVYMSLLLMLELQTGT